MNLKKYKSFIIAIAFLSIAIFFLYNQNIFSLKIKNINKNNIKFIEIGDKKLKVELAVSQKEQEKGLSGRKEIGDDEAMLFIFKKPQKNFFWMKDMNFPIDIIWIDENFKVIYIKENVLPSSYPENFGPGVDNMYVLEVKSGFSKKNNLEINENIKFLP